MAPLKLAHTLLSKLVWLLLHSVLLFSHASLAAAVLLLWVLKDDSLSTAHVFKFSRHVSLLSEVSKLMEAMHAGLFVLRSDAKSSNAFFVER